jgi:hypothetical protein
MPRSSFVQQESQGSRPREVTVVRRDDCRHAPAAVAAIQALADALGVSIVIEQVLVQTDEEARATRCIGSPTVLINGHDVEPGARGPTSFGTT